DHLVERLLPGPRRPPRRAPGGPPGVRPLRDRLGRRPPHRRPRPRDRGDPATPGPAVGPSRLRLTGPRALAYHPAPFGSLSLDRPLFSSARMAAPSPEPRVIDRLASLATILEWALGLRVLAADLVHWSLPKGALCVFPDTKIYWALA